MSLDEVVSRVERYGCSLVEITGGEPLAQKECPSLLSRLADAGHGVLLETSGALPIEGLDPRVSIIMDLKCPDSGESHRNLYENLGQLKPGDEVKFVLASRRDYDWAREQVRHRLAGRAALFSPVWGALDPAELAAWVLQDRLQVRVQVQLHKLLFGAETRGV
jgi:7-carboxy-7-deazaguanine synthase